MKVLFIGYAINLNDVSKVYGASFAGNKMQISILKHLENFPETIIKSITIYPTAPFPKGEEFFVKRGILNLFNNFYSLKIGYLNVPVLKKLFIVLSTYLEARRIIKNESIEIILTFNMFPDVGLPARWLKKRFGCKIVSILADLPIDGTVRKSMFSGLLKKYYYKLTRDSIPYCDKIIALNRFGVELYAPGINCIIVEGGVDLDDIKVLPEKYGTKKNIVYSGTLAEYSGIINLIEAMKYVTNENVFLDIYGAGQSEGRVKELTRHMRNVKFHGIVDNDTIKQLQHEAYLLVNPRPVDNKIAMVTFPSKILEYMLSGTPVLSTKLNAFSEDYFDKMFFVDNNEPLILAQRLNEIMDLPEFELRKIALLARQFVIGNKTWRIQCERIHEFIKKPW